MSARGDIKVANINRPDFGPITRSTFHRFSQQQVRVATPSWTTGNAKYLHRHLPSTQFRIAVSLDFIFCAASGLL
jgi:hypothetical protein